jgi:hypothetical protein
VVNEPRIEELGDAIHVVFILEDSRELPDDLFVLFLLHGEFLIAVNEYPPEAICRLAIVAGAPVSPACSRAIIKSATEFPQA